MITRPMLAATLPINDDGSITYPIPFPVYASPKLDGIRCLKINGKAVTRNFKPIPNRYIREQIESADFDNVDGELVLENTTGEFTDVTSAVMSYDGQPNFKYIVFDSLSAKPFASDDINNSRFREYYNRKYPSFVYPLFQNVVPDMTALEISESLYLKQGYEGVMLRRIDSMQSPYKSGRSTLREFYLVKVKRFSESDAEVIGFEELMVNQNEATQDAFGLQERNSKQEGLVPGNTLGALIVIDIHPNSPFKGVEFKIGTGFSADQRSKFWEAANSNYDNFIGQIVNYKYQKHGSKDAPRFPVFLKFKES